MKVGLMELSCFSCNQEIYGVVRGVDLDPEESKYPTVQVQTRKIPTSTFK